MQSPTPNPRERKRPAWVICPFARTTFTRLKHVCGDRAGYAYHVCRRQPGHEGECRCACGETWDLPF